ncbi:hypothetical protein, partial [Pseudomonas sp. GL-B-16]|uniref:hypothetical protein n=1 Tax=Pseudomonas sp. GL-B-16 TaxID=2832373 RepID=UPI001CC07E4C
GSESDKRLAGLLKDFMQRDLLQISPNQQQTDTTGIVQYGVAHNEDVLVVQARLNRSFKYDILRVALRSASEERVSIWLPQPRDEAAGIARSQPPLLSRANEFQQQFAEQTGRPNNEYALTTQSTAPSRRTTPQVAEHLALMGSLPATRSPQHRSAISRFLRHLEVQDPPQRWSALAPAGERRPVALEAAVNTAMTQHGLHASTRAAINVGFNLDLRGAYGR